MGKLIVCNIISLDGFFEGPDHDVMVMPFDQGFSEYNVQRLRTADTLLLGKTTFENFLKYWPEVADSEDAESVEREISRLNNSIQKVVVSDSLTVGQTAPWSDTRIVKRGDANAEVAKMKAEEGGDILVFGSHILWNDLLANGLVDELHLMIGAGVVGEGVRAFETRPPGSLRLMDTRTFDGSSLLLVRYGVER